MDCVVTLILFSMFWKLSTSIQCYKCEPENSAYVHVNTLCSEFDYSDAFKTDCEYSTVCVKKVTSLTLKNGMTVSSVYRGCAPQVLSGDQVKKDGKWYPVKRIYEEYDMGCTEPKDSEKVTKSTVCYCKGSLCNTAASITINVLVLTFITNGLLIVLG
ncbi:hypothetical protein K1T71_011246 [Dendrolimus kikuchii]|uniref:Uncharacterized protein n=1 Tax=Dendrolimus kikuchii TaxID=765133 RepID=A0ACC1CNB6_9NEOP|nr:hypothetical protein K1T71_011246 [Dendrolimus kikuchii]